MQKKKLTCPVLVTSVSDIPPLIFPMDGGGGGGGLFFTNFRKCWVTNKGYLPHGAARRGARGEGGDRLLGTEGHKEAKILYHLEYCQLITYISGYWYTVGTYTVGSSDFPRSLCFMWFWFGLEILRLVNKKPFWKKISLKLGVQGIKRSGILHWFQKCVELLRQEVPKDFFLRKAIFC